MTSVQQGFDDSHDLYEVEFPLKEVNSFYFRFVDHAYKGYSLKDVEGYVDIQINHRQINWSPNGTEIRKGKTYQMKDCELSDFMKSDFEKKYAQYRIKTTPSLCINDPDNEIYVQGTRDSAVFQKNQSFIAFEVYRCNNETTHYNKTLNMTVNNTCKTEDEIDEFISNKNVLPIIINKQANFDSFEDFTTEMEMWQVNMKLGPGLYTDAGYRFRLNNYERKDRWYFPLKEESSFTDLTFFAHNEFNLPKGYR